MSHNVFISFSSKDIETALRIYEGLSNRGAKCWISARHVSPGGNYQNEIVSALTSSSVMVLIYSHNANASAEIQKEIALAGQLQLTVIPLKIDDVMPSGGFILNLATSQWVEVFPNFEIILDAVSLQINAIAERIEKFALEVRQALEADGVIEPDDQKYLEDEVGIRMGLTAAQSRAIIKGVIGDSNRSSVQDRELDYLKLIAEVLEDGKITSLERRRLADRAKSLGINESRAEALLKQEGEKNGIASVAPPLPIIVPESVPIIVDESDEDEGADDGHEVTDRVYWENRASKATLNMIDTLFGLIKQLDSNIELNFKQKYIGLVRNEKPDNFVVFTPQKNAARVSPRIPQSEELDRKIDESGLTRLAYGKHSQRYRIRLVKGDVEQYVEIFKYLFSIAYH
jgi:predicted transport protein